MTNRTRRALGVALILAGVLGIELMGLRSGTTGVIILIVLAVIAATIVAVRVELKWAGMAAALASAFTLTWNGWFIGPLRPGDALILIALVCFVLADPNQSLRWPPWWVKQLGIAILFVATIHIFFPANASYLSTRTVLSATGKRTVSTKGSLTSANLGVGVKFIIATVFVAVVFAAAARVDKRAVRWLLVAFTAGSAASGWAAFSDKLGLTHLSKLILSGGKACASSLGAQCATKGTDRQLGFSNHPNFLAAGLTLSIPLAIWLMAKRDRTRAEAILGAVLLPGLVLGTYASGSRGGAVCAVLALGVSVLMFPSTRRNLPAFALVGAIAVTATIALVPSLADTILRVTRLKNTVSTAGSDTVRTLVGQQGIADWHHAPIQGVGLQVSFEASQVYIQELASGGLLLFAAMSIYMLGGMLTSFDLMRRGDDLGGAILGSLLVILALNIFEADLTDRFYYVPIAILVAHLYKRELEARESEPEPEDERASTKPVSRSPAGSIS